MNEEIVTIGKKIKECRIRANLSVAEFAKLTGTSRSGVYQWEAGIRGITAQSLMKVCKTLKIESKDILGV